MKNIIGAKSPAAAQEPRESSETVKFVTVDEESAGQRLDNFLFRHLKGVPKTHVYRIIRSGEVRVNKGRAQADTKIESGDVLRFAAAADFGHVTASRTGATGAGA